MRRLIPSLALLLAWPAAAGERAVETKIVVPVSAPTISAAPSLTLGASASNLALPLAAAPSALAVAPRAQAAAKAAAGKAQPPTKAVVAAQAQLQAHAAAAGHVNAGLAASAGGESGKTASAAVFDGAGFAGKARDAFSPSSETKDGSASSPDYRRALRELGAGPGALGALEAAADGRGRTLASWAAMIAQERRLPPAKALALIAGALLHGASDPQRALARVAARSDGLEIPHLDAAWADRLDLLSDVLDAARSPGDLAELTRDERFEFLPSALREAALEAARFHARKTPPSPAFSLQAGAGAGFTEKSAGPFDDGFKPRREVLRLLGFNPASEPGVLLSDPQKHRSWVARVRGKNGSLVVKIAPEPTIINELAMRGMLEAFSELGAHLSAPRSLAYRRWFLDPVLVMEDVPGTRLDGRQLPLVQKAALALFALTFGVHDLNPGAFLSVGWDRSVLADFERARDPVDPGSEIRVGSLSDTPWVSQFHLNDYEDYRPALEAWSRRFSRPETRSVVAAILSRAGVGPAQIEKDLDLFRRNLFKLPATLQADIAYANRVFRDEAKRAGLGWKQAKALSAVNKSAVRSPEGGVLRDVLRRLNGDRRASPPFHVEPAEAAAFARKRPFSPAARRALAADAVRGEVRGLDGKPLSPAAVLAAYDALTALF